MTDHFCRAMLALGALCALSSTAAAGVAPLLETTWGQDGDWQASLPIDTNGDRTYAGCTTVAAAQVLYYYQHQATASTVVDYKLDHDVTGPDIEDRWLYLDLTEVTHDWSAMARHDTESRARTDETADFLYHVAATLGAQFGDPSGSPATARFVENAFRYEWGFNSIPRREMSIIGKDIFEYSDEEWAALMFAELDAGRPVLYMAQQVGGTAGHAFVIDGYRDDGMVHVNWGWGGFANGYYDPNSLTDHKGRAWSRDPMIFRGLEPTKGFAAAMGNVTENTDGGSEGYTWTGNGSLIARASGSATGYGLTQDEAAFDSAAGKPAVFFQWEVDATDGSALQIDADSAAGDTVDIVYGTWDDRSADRIFRNVTLPFVLDPTTSSSDADGAFFVVAVLMDDADGSGVVTAEATTARNRGASSAAAPAIVVDGHTWNGNGSIIGKASGSATGYGLTQDETVIHPGGDPVVFFQWEVDTSDGDELVISADGSRTATISYGPWNGDRSADVTRSVTLPYTVAPSDAESGAYYVVRVEFDSAPSSTVTVAAEVE